uniref:AP2/ERF domain-containing protein n=1 Tax=Kalanchoe fedtschenkoi TaxID=63787 RepID=A0A7N0TW06_KALFE
MDVFSQYSDPLPFSSLYSQSTDQRDNSSVSDSRIGRTRSYSDEDIMLASSHPKKRAGRKKFRETRHPVYRGVRRRNSNRWVCEVREPNKKNRIWLGTYPTAEMAARAHDVAALAFRGLKSCLNFADSAWRLPVPASTDAADIQRAAAEAAEMFRTPEDTDNLNKGNIVCTMGEASSGNNKNEPNRQTQQGTSYYVDEEAIFDMPGLLNNMAEGLLLPPPSFLDGEFTWDNAENDTDLTLWNHSI